MGGTWRGRLRTFLIERFPDSDAFRSFVTDHFGTEAAAELPQSAGLARQVDALLGWLASTARFDTLWSALKSDRAEFATQITELEAAYTARPLRDVTSGHHIAIPLVGVALIATGIGAYLLRSTSTPPAPTPAASVAQDCNQLAIEDVIASTIPRSATLEVSVRNLGSSAINITRANVHVIKDYPPASSYGVSASYALTLTGDDNPHPVRHILTKKDEVDAFTITVTGKPHHAYDTTLTLFFNGECSITYKDQLRLVMGANDERPKPFKCGETSTWDEPTKSFIPGGICVGQQPPMESIEQYRARPRSDCLQFSASSGVRCCCKESP